VKILVFLLVSVRIYFACTTEYFLFPFLAQAFLNPKDFDHQTIELAADTMNGFELAETFSRVLGRPMKYEKMQARDETHRLMVDWIENNKFMVDVENLKKKYNVKMKSVEEFIAENKLMFK
jgi:uncharacterized protein YbjT (DUF2867 family)